LIEDKIYIDKFPEELINDWRKNGQKVVFTNGCFDVLHKGHVQYLEKAKLLGHRLIVGLNSDQSVVRLKGKNRPVQNQESRAFVLAALESVDVVVLFDEDTPLNLILRVKPNILVKGGDYSEEDIVGAKEIKQRGGRVERIDFSEGYSTTAIIDKIKSTSY